MSRRGAGLRTRSHRPLPQRNHRFPQALSPNCTLNRWIVTSPHSVATFVAVHLPSFAWRRAWRRPPARSRRGVAKGSVNLSGRTGHELCPASPRFRRARRSNVLRCGRWCEVVYAGRKGWASAAYIARGSAPRGGYVILPDKSLCHGPGVWSNPYCEWPIERSAREFSHSTWEYNNRQDHGGRRRWQKAIESGRVAFPCPLRI